MNQSGRLGDVDSAALSGVSLNHFVLLSLVAYGLSTKFWLDSPLQEGSVLCLSHTSVTQILELALLSLKKEKIGFIREIGI